MEEREEHAAETDYRALYEQEHRDFAAYRQEAESRAEEAEKRRCYEQLLRRAGMAERRIAPVLRATDLGALRLAGGGLADEGELLRQIRREWGELLPDSRVETPPHGGRTVTRESILRMTDTGERQRAIAQHHELFGI